MKKVLVVDDSEVVRQQVGTCLAAADFKVVEAGDGIDALARLTEHPDVAIVILDINMPRMNGLEMLEELRKSGKIATLPVLVLTTEADPALVAKAKQAGAKGWVVKPLKSALLLAAVKKLTGVA
jgi:two-component system, chemotaxis family, chemotaxis protein CheY